MRTATVLSLLLAWLPLAGCTEGSAPAPDGEAGGVAERAWPEGTVLAVEDLPISVDEVDAASVWVERIDRKASPDHLRRLALTNVVLPAKVAQMSTKVVLMLILAR